MVRQPLFGRRVVGVVLHFVFVGLEVVGTDLRACSAPRDPLRKPRTSPRRPGLRRRRGGHAASVMITALRRSPKELRLSGMLETLNARPPGPGPRRRTRPPDDVADVGSRPPRAGCAVGLKCIRRGPGRDRAASG